MQRLLCTSICFVVAAGFATLATAANADEPTRVQQDGPVPHAGPEVSRPVGSTWIVEFANGVTETYWFHAEGLVSVFETKAIARVTQTVKDNSVEIVFGDDRRASPSLPLSAIPAPSSPGTRVELWTRVGKRCVVERWSPGSQFPTATPLRGIAECPEGGPPGAITGIMQLGGRVKFSDQRALLLVSFEGPRTLTDMYIGALEGVKDLTALRLVETEVTDRGLMALARGRRGYEIMKGDGLKNLTHLEFTGKLSDTGLQYLGEMTQLRQLHLQRTGLVTDAGLNHLKGLTNLESLILTGCKVTDAGLEHLKGLTKLEKLDLSETDVSDAGLEHLKGLTKLKFLMLKRTNVTAAGVEKLQQALPNCQIGYSRR